MKNQKKQIESKKDEIPLMDKYRNLMIMYFDIVLRGILTFILVGITEEIILVGFFKMKNPIILLLIIFISSVIVAPFFAKIKMSEKIIDKIEVFLKIK